MLEDLDYPFTIAFNISAKNCACVILQTLYGASCPTEVTMLFHKLGWELVPNEDIKVFTAKSKEDIKKLLDYCDNG